MTFWKTHSRNTQCLQLTLNLFVLSSTENSRDCTADYHFQVDVFPAKLSKMLL